MAMPGEALSAVPGFDAQALEALAPWFEEARFAAGDTVLAQGDPGDALYVILEGEVSLKRDDLELSLLRAGDCFGELALILERPRAATVEALGACRLARLDRSVFERMQAESPALAMTLMRVVVANLRRRLLDVTDAVATLLRERGTPLRAEIQTRCAGEWRHVKVGTLVGQLLPKEVEGTQVVAGTVDGRLTSLDAPVFGGSEIAALPRSHWEGREIYRHSAALLLLEAAARLPTPLAIHIGPSVGFGWLVSPVGDEGPGLTAHRQALLDGVNALRAADVDIREERWTIAEAQSWFGEAGWDEASQLLALWRSGSVPVAGCGGVFTLRLDPVVPSAGHIGEIDLLPAGRDLLLHFGDAWRPTQAQLDQQHPGGLAREHEAWLQATGVTSVGAYNALCVSGQVAEIVRVSEAFHEKRISQIADEAAHRDPPVRIICVAGPSSAGKTTFIRRLKIQLLVSGRRPRVLSLDDYYVDRVKTPLDEKGEYDYEALEAIDLPLLGEHLRRLLAGETLRTARYDFKSGQSDPTGGSELTLGTDDVLLIEGIHGLNPKLPLPEADAAFRILVNPASSLPIDRLSRVNVSDLRLLRRIVRDRHQRGISAAENLRRWPDVREGERKYIFPYLHRADAVFNSSLIYEPSVLRVYAERYLLEVPPSHESFPSAHRLRRLIDTFVPIYPDHVPPTSLIREFIGGSGFEY